jgi:hypothetical protein
MAFDWKEFLLVAKHLSSLSSATLPSEAGYRSAVSRAYYAAYCHARNFARDRQGFIPSKSSSDHAKVRDHFRAKNLVIIATQLDNLRQWRNDCDYEDSISYLNPLFLNTPIIEAENIINILV